MAQAKLGKRTIDALERSERDQFLWDENLSGFGLKVTPAGGKVFIFQYRLGGRGTKTKRWTIGRYGAPWTPAKAREEAERLSILVSQGPACSLLAARTNTSWTRSGAASHPARLPRYRSSPARSVWNVCARPSAGA
ncbi:Arm DNA-binding domain-containing protein [Sphingobium yanoikuyae]|jgi:hypothetical protein|uniref:Arm DNA-binding domain-containing protein n=1 Tax=Sphingobium yanoikuyae TaxID=13690 RepID=UPI003F01FEFF